MSFAEMSKSLRKEKNITQEQLAKELNVSKSCISMIEIGKNEPTANTLIKYANFFQCSTDYLLEREDDFGNILFPLTQNPHNELSSTEKELLKIFKSLDSNHRVQILEYAQYFAERSKNAKRNF